MEWITIKNFLILQALLVVGGIIYLRRRTPTGTRLNFSGKRPGESSIWDASAGAASGAPSGAPSDSGQSSNNHETGDAPEGHHPGERALNVHFNYNGHSWDAYEVLGIPAGSSAESVSKAYQSQIAKLDPESRELVELAYKAIRG